MSRQPIGATPLMTMCVLAAFAIAACPALAADPANPATGVHAQPAAVAPTAPTGGTVTAPQTAGPARPLSPEEAALKQIFVDGQTHVAALLAEGQSDPTRMPQVQKEIEKVKLETNVRFLQAKVDFARDRGDEAGRQEAQLALDHLLHPPVPAAVPSDREQSDLKAQEVRK